MDTRNTKAGRPSARTALTESRIRTSIKEAIDATSVRRVATALGLSDEATLRLAGGMRVQRGTLLVAERALSTLSRRDGRR